MKITGKVDQERERASWTILETRFRLDSSKFKANCLVRKSSNSLRMIDDGDRFGLDLFLNAIDLSDLFALEVARAWRSSDGVHGHIDTAIARLHSLKFLSITGRIFTSLLFPQLLTLPSLTTLKFNGDYAPAYDDIALLLARKPSSLKLIELNHLFAERGPSNLDLDVEWEEDGQIVPHPQWTPPFWGDELTRSDVDSLLVTAEAAGISLGDSIKTAIAIEDDYVAELRYCEARQAEMAYEAGGNTDVGEDEESWYGDEDGGVSDADEDGGGDLF